MKINSYTIWKSEQRKYSSSNLIGSDDALFIFLRAFPDIESVLFNKSALTFIPNQEHFDFIVQEIKEKLIVAEKKDTWKYEWTQEQIELIRKGGHIQKINFQGIELEINTFGQSENNVILELVSLYNTFMESKGGLKITTEWLNNKNSGQQ